jgi:hypothetical protein
MEKFAISFAIMIVMLLLSFSIVQMSNAQSNNSQVAPTTLTNYTEIFGENKEYQICYSVLEPEECFPTIDVLYQSPETITLKSDTIDVIWKGVDLIKKDGYKIDDITSYPVSSLIDSRQNINILVVMSR